MLGRLLTDCHEEGRLILGPAAHIQPHAEVRAGQAQGDALGSGGGAHRPVVKSHCGVIGVPVVNTWRYKCF